MFILVSVFKFRFFLKSLVWFCFMCFKEKFFENYVFSEIIEEMKFIFVIIVIEVVLKMNWKGVLVFVDEFIEFI